jgi:hypothetical protein
MLEEHGQSGKEHVFLIQDDHLTAELHYVDLFFDKSTDRRANITHSATAVLRRLLSDSGVVADGEGLAVTMGAGIG